MSIKIQVDTAVEVFVNVVPLTDSTDFITIEDNTVAYNQAGMDLNWNFITTAGVVTQTNVVPTVAGNYDWAHVGNGMYKIEIPASGGVSINNDTEGVGWFSGICTGVLAWVSPQYEFIPAVIANSLVNGTDYLQTDVIQIEGTDATDQVTTAATASLNSYDPPTRAELTTDTNSILSKLLKYVQLILRSDAAIATDNATELTAINADGGSGVGSFSNQTDSEEAIRDRGDSAWITAVGFATHTAADVWAVATRVLTAGTNIVLAKGVGLTGLNDVSSADVNAACDTALTDYDAPTNAEMVARTLLAAQYGTAANQTNIEADTQDIQTRLPAALVGGRMNSDATAISGSPTAADQLEASAETIVSGSAIAGTLSTTQMTTNLTEATNDHYNGRVVIWTSGVLQDQATDITDYDGASKMLTYTAITEAPGIGDGFVIV